MRVVISSMAYARRPDRPCRRHAALVQEDLLRPQRDRRALLGRQRERFVRPLQCSDWVPPRTAASACSATLTMLLSGCCAVSVLPAVWVWKRSCCARGFVAPKRSRMMRAQSRRAARNFGDLLEEVVVGVEEERQSLPERIDVEPGGDGGLDVGDAIGEVKATS